MSRRSEDSTDLTAGRGKTGKTSRQNEASLCIGYGPFDTRKHDPEKWCQNVADTPARLWCQRCEALRREAISAQFATINGSFEDLARSGGLAQ